MRRSTKARHFITVGSRKNEGTHQTKMTWDSGEISVQCWRSHLLDGASINTVLTETQGLELVLGVGERCTVTSAIQRPGSGHLRAGDGGETGIMIPKRRKATQTLAVCLLWPFLPLSLCSTVCLTTPRLFPL